MKFECVLYDKDKRPIDWYDPIDSVNDVIESDGGLTITHSNGNIYFIDRKNYSSYVVREI